MDTTTRKPYPSWVSDDEWALAVPSLTLMRPEAPQLVDISHHELPTIERFPHQPLPSTGEPVFACAWGPVGDVTNGS